MFLLGASSTARTARADEPRTEPATPAPKDPPRPPPDATDDAPTTVPTRWYGWQVLLCDTGAAIQLGIGAGVDSTVLYVTGGSTYLICPLVVHFLHNQMANMGWSGGVRILVPTLGAGIGYAAASGSSGGARDRASVVGLAIGTGVAAVFDVVFLAREDLPAWERTGTLRGVTPVIGAGTVGLAGRF